MKVCVCVDDEDEQEEVHGSFTLEDSQRGLLITLKKNKKK